MNKPQPHPRPRSRISRDTSNGAILDAIDDLRMQMTKMDTQFDALPDVFMPRREHNEVISAIKDRQSDHNSRLTALEEWRLSEIQKASQQQTAVQKQIANTENDQNNKREEWLRVAVSVMGSLIVSLLVFILGYIATHH